MTGTHGLSAPDACSVGFDRAGVSAYGTAARAGFFVALEQAGPWGREAATQSHLPAGLGRELADACASRGGRLTLIRRPGPHADDHHSTSGHTAYLAWAGPSPWLLQAVVADPAALLAADLDALARGDRDAVARSVPGARDVDPVLLVCTNGRRDVCCAVRGRPVALDAHAERPGRVWEASHTGGHRFAPTGVLLPHGATLARLDTALAVDALDAAVADQLPTALLGEHHDRGRSSLEPGAQAAESHVRTLTGETSLTALTAASTTTSGPDEAARFTVEHRDGRRWLVQVSRTEVAALPESCGKAAITVSAWEPRVLEA
jgi:hypothetical protein